MKKGQITPKQWDRFKVIDHFIQKHGRLPVCREVCELFHLKSTSTAFDTLKQYSRQHGGK